MAPPLRRYVILLCDGARADLMEELLRRGDLPAIGRHFADDGMLGRATTVFPSTTGPAHLPFITGCFPGTCNMPGIRWMDRAEYARTLFSLTRFRSYIGPGALAMGRDVPASVPSLFRELPDHASVYGNCTPGIRRGRDTTFFFKLARQAWVFAKVNPHETDEYIREYTVRAVARRPDFLFAGFYGVDYAGHMAGVEDPLTRRCYQRFDAAVGAVFAALDRAGTRDETLVALVSDHGLTSTHAHLDLDALVRRHLGRTLAYPNVLSGIVGARAACMVSGNAMANVYVRGPRGWPEPTVDDELPLGAHALIDELLAHEGVDLVATRAAAGAVRVRSRRGEAVIGRAAGGAVTYAVAGSDPFGYPPLPAVLDDAALLAATFDSGYPDAPSQLLQHFAAARSGDVAVTARPGWDLRRAHVERPVHFGSHGALCREHMLVPFGLSRRAAAGPRRTVDLMPAALLRLGRRAPPCDGRAFDIE